MIVNLPAIACRCALPAALPNLFQGAIFMKNALIAVIAVALLATVYPASAHGGGCRKASPPGQCCHRDNSTGLVHCH